MTGQVDDARVNRMLTHMRAFQKMPGRWDEGEKGRVHAQFQAAWDSATVPERQRYQTAILQQIMARAPVRQPAAVVDLADRRRQSRQQPPESCPPAAGAADAHPRQAPVKTPGARAPRPRRITPAQLEQIRERTRLLHNQAMDRLVQAEPPEIRRQPRVRSPRRRPR
jgi:hypothetical protein